MPRTKPWQEPEFLQYLKDNPAAERAINKLVTENCSRERLILLLRAASNPNRKQIWNSFVQEVAPSRQRAIRVAQVLEQACVELRRLACNPFGAMSFAFHEALESMLRSKHAAFYGDASGIQKKADDPRALADAMELQARHLLEWSASPVIALSSRTFSFRTLWKHFPIAAVAHVVRRRKGQIPWGDLAYALEAVAAGYGIITDISPDALRKEHNGFIRSSAGKAFQKSGGVDLLLRLFFPPF